jgi:hypothetical protein
MASSVVLVGCYSYCDEMQCDGSPDKGELIVKVPIDEHNSYVIVELYRGRFEDNLRIRTDTLRKEKRIYTMTTNRWYAIKASYSTSDSEVSRVIEERLYPTYDECDCVESDGVARFDFRNE